MRLGVPVHDQPRAAAAAVMPVFLETALGIVAQIDIVEPLIHRLGIVGGRPLDRRIAELGEFFRRARAAIWALDQHGVSVPFVNAGWVWRRHPFHRSYSRARSGRADRAR